MIRSVVRVEGASGSRLVDLDELVRGEVAERAASSANRWIKSLRDGQIDGRPFRDRFTHRGDSLWWFAELFLHKEGVVDRLWRTALGLEALLTDVQPAAVGIESGDAALARLLPQAAARHGASLLCTPPGAAADPGAAHTSLKGRFYAWSARASRLVRRSVSASQSKGGTLAFVHPAFWRARSAGNGEEGYIGAVLDVLAREADAGPLRLVGVGPVRNFRAHRWWDALRPSTRAAWASIPVLPVEQFATAGSQPADEIWRRRAANRDALLGSTDLRARALVDGYDVWPIVARELAGVADLQFPWSARSMDEAAAALDACRPRVVVTYAEAGGWGRAIMLEARRRGIPTAGLQHGFIYRHWLNYRHEPDEMRPSAANPEDRGFPRPDLTLVYDGFAAAHLESAGAFPASRVAISGSPALDRLVAGVSRIDDRERSATRARLGIGSEARLAILVSKQSQIALELPAIVAAIDANPGAWLVIKPHPAETPDVYREVLRGARRVVLAPPDLDLAHLLASAQAIVTVNSTVAIDAMVLGVPGLAVGLPNNLSPMVEAGALAGVGRGEDVGQPLVRVLADEAWRNQLCAAARTFVATYGMRADGRAAERAAAAIAALGRSPVAS